MNPSAFENRVSSVRKLLRDCDCALVTRLENIRYLTGFTGSAGLFVITPESQQLVVDGRYTVQAKDQTSFQVIERQGLVEAALVDYLQGGKRCAVEASHLTLATFDRIDRANRDKGISLVPMNGFVENVRIRKSEEEIERLRAACELLETLMTKTIENVKEGKREIEVAVEYEAEARLATACSLPFEPIIASGYRSALPHGIASKKTIERGDFVVIDIGLELDGYIADMTRTVAVGEADSRMREVHAAVVSSNQAASKNICPGQTGEEAHNHSLKILEDADLGKYYSHGLGHGLGVEVHEAPRLAPKVQGILDINMVFTIEPGAYIPDWGGVRVEDAGVLRKDGIEIFNKLDHDLIVV